MKKFKIQISILHNLPFTKPNIFKLFLRYSEFITELDKKIASNYLASIKRYATFFIQQWTFQFPLASFRSGINERQRRSWSLQLWFLVSQHTHKRAQKIVIYFFLGVFDHKWKGCSIWHHITQNHLNFQIRNFFLDTLLLLKFFELLILGVGVFWPWNIVSNLKGYWYIFY